MPGPGECPDAQTMREFLLGLLDATWGDEFSQHLEGCARCLNAVRNLKPSDPFVSALCQASAILSSPLPSVVATVMGSMYLLRPNAAPKEPVAPALAFVPPPWATGDLGS